jgi:hypothetical protein
MADGALFDPWEAQPFAGLVRPVFNVYSSRMQNGHGTAVLEEMLAPLNDCFGLETARAVAALRVSEKAQARVNSLAEKCNEGKMTSDERAEYEAYVQASTLIGILQAKARRVLTRAKGV